MVKMTARGDGGRGLVVLAAAVGGIWSVYLR